MRNFANKEAAKSKSVTPFCQATGCFDHAQVYVVVKETEATATYEEMARENAYEKKTKQIPSCDSETDFDGFKLILYLCGRHQNDFQYLLNGSELYIAKREFLGSSGFHSSSK